LIELIIATFCSASIALLFKYSAVKGLDQKLVTVWNYVMAALISGRLIITQNKLAILGFDDHTFETIGFGVITGILYLVSFTVYQISVRKNGASLSGMFAKLGILVPMTLSIILWKELPTWIQAIGICLALLAIAIANSSPKGSSASRPVLPILIAVFIAGGFAEFLNKLFQRSGLLDYKPIYLFIVFITALCISLWMLIRRKEPAEKPIKSMLVGAMVGLPNLFSSYFLIDALEKLPASLVFPAFSAGSILLITVLSHVIFKEQLFKKDWIAILATTMGLIMMNM